MPSQRYTRWRTADQEFDEDGEENGELTEPRDQEEVESRRAFTLMTPTRDSANNYQTIFSRKFVLVAALICIFCLFGGAFMGFYVGYTHHIDHPWHKDLPIIPEVKPSPVPVTLCSTPEPFEDIPTMSIKLLKHLSIYDIRNHTRALTNGKPSDICTYIKSSLEQYGYKVTPLVYSVTTSYHQRDSPSTVSVLFNNGTEHVFSTNLRTNSKNETFTVFNGYSANGTFSGPVIYGNLGTESDLTLLQEANITVNNSILLLRQGHLHPSIQVRNAEKFGVKAVILYPDPNDFGGHDNATNPRGNILPEDGVITESLRVVTADPATVGYVSESHVYRVPADKLSDIPTIPVQSISSMEAKFLFSVLDGPLANTLWNGSASSINTLGGLFRPELNIRSVRVSVFTDIGTTNVDSVHGFLPSEDATKVIHIGTHYDESVERLPLSAVSIAAWLSFAGALSKAFPHGTRRKVMFSAFSGTQGDYSAGGEYAELFSTWLHSTAMAYIDFDDILKGTGYLEARASPLMRKLIKNAYHHVEWPGKDNTSVFHGLLDARALMELQSNQWNEQESGKRFTDSDEIKDALMCGESTNFYGKHGIPTVNLAAVDSRKRNYHLKNSQYDDLKTGIQMMDPDLEWTYMITALLSICSIILSNTPLPPVDYQNFASNLNKEWIAFTDEEKRFMNTYKGDLSEITYPINGELDILNMVFKNLDAWYGNTSATEDIKSHRKREESLMQFMMLSRHFLRPESVPSPLKGGSLLTFGPDVENACEGVSFPTAKKILYDIRKNESTWTDFKKELSLILSAISSLNSHIGMHS